MVRGIEHILRGRDPRDAWAFAQRICGVCTLVLGLASVRAVENALGIEVSPNAQLIRNLMISTQYVHDHVMHFYHLHALDWVDVVSVLKRGHQGDFRTRAIHQPLCEIFAQLFRRHKKTQDLRRRWPTRDFQLRLLGAPGLQAAPGGESDGGGHYLEALVWQREAAKLHTIFGGKNPHPNFLVGGVPSAISEHSTVPGHGPQIPRAASPARQSMW